MKAFVVLSLVACAMAAPQVKITPIGEGAPAIVRAPAHDSASIESHRLGGNFAYATAEAHAYAKTTPQLSRATFPVAETTYVHEPETVARVVPAKIVNTHHAAKPVFGQQAVYAQQPVVGPVAKHTTVHQQVYKQKHVSVHQPAPVVQHQPAVAHVAKTVVQPVAETIAQPAVAYAAAPAVAAHGYAAAPAAYAHHGYAAAPAAYGLGLGHY